MIMGIIINKEGNMRQGNHRRGSPWLKERLASEGFRSTASRKIITDVLARTSRHLSAEEIYFIVRGINPSIGFATIYRTLDLLTRMGIVQKFDFGEGKARYELVGNPQKDFHHHHLVCTRCKKIIDYTNFLEDEKELIKKTEEALSAKHGFEIKSHIIHFYGICGECKQDGV